MRSPAATARPGEHGELREYLRPLLVVPVDLAAPMPPSRAARWSAATTRSGSGTGIHGSAKIKGEGHSKEQPNKQAVGVPPGRRPGEGEAFGPERERGEANWSE